MAAEPTDYVFHSAIECERQERQNALQGIESHLRHFEPGPGSRILDAGCGSGAITRLLGSRYPSAEVIGIDINPGYISWARNRASIDGLGNVSFEIGNLQSLPFRDESFDAVWSKFVLPYMPNPEFAIREFRRVTRLGGTVVIETIDNWLCTNCPEDPHLQQRLEKVVPQLGDPVLARKLPLMLRAAGFEDVHLEVELDPTFTAIGPIGPDHRRNLEEAITAGLPRIAQLLDGHAEADTFLADLLAYLDDPNTCSYSTLWTAKGVAG